MGERAQSDGFIVGPWVDVFAFILAPLIALVVGQAVALAGLDRAGLTINGLQIGLVSTVSRTLIHAHQAAVFVRTHNNPAIFRQHRLRFTAVPAALVVATLVSDQALGALLVVSALWDVYHTSMQTFGLCRIYDTLKGNPPSRGRAWDLGFAHAIYVVPILAGPLLPVVLDVFTGIAQLGETRLMGVPASATQLAASVRPVLVVGAAVYVVAYAIAWWRLVGRGHVLSPQKLLLMFTSSAACIAAVGFDTVGMGLLVINVFHAVQYLALVWHVEGARVAERIHVESRTVAMGMLLVVLALYGIFAGALPGLSGDERVYRVLLAVSSVITVLHFWYDGFVWSVRKQEATA